MADIMPCATRVAILRKRAELDAIPLADVSVLELIADRVTDSIRSLEGALIRVVPSTRSPTGRSTSPSPQPVLTCDRLPRAPVSLQPRLRERFEVAYPGEHEGRMTREV